MDAFYKPFRMGIHPEGRRLLAGMFLVLAAFVVLVLALPLPVWLKALLAASAAALQLFALNFFRAPRRPAAVKDGRVVSPADGKVVALEPCYEPEYLKTDCLKISIFMSAWDVHINWAPFPGEVTYRAYHAGAFFLAFNPKSSYQNENAALAIKNGNGKEVLLRQIAGFVARRVKTYPEVGDKLTPPQQLGFIKFGSRVDIYLPKGTHTTLKTGQKVYGNHTDIARL